MRKDKCIKHGITDVYLTKGKGNYICIKCAEDLKVSIKSNTLHICKPVERKPDILREMLIELKATYVSE